jgi:hypothetical protein
MYIATMCAGGTLKLFQGVNEDTIEFKSELLFGKNLQEAIGLTQLGEKNLLLTVGGYDSNIHTYLIPRIPFQTDKNIFKYKFSLLGHFNSIKAFAFTPLLDDGIRYMATCSQD